MPDTRPEQPGEYDVEPIQGQPGWYWDNRAGRAIHESELLGPQGEDDDQDLDDFDYDEDDDNEIDRDDIDNDEEPKEEGEQEDSSEEGSENENQEGGDENPETDANPEESAESTGDQPGQNAEDYNPSQNADDLARNAERDALRDSSEMASEAAESAAEGVAEAGAEAVAEAGGEAAVAGTSEIWGPILIIFVIVIIIVQVVIFSMALMGYGDANTPSYYTGGSYATSAQCQTIFSESGVTLAQPNSAGLVPLPSYTGYKSYGTASRQWGKPEMMIVLVCVSKQWTDSGNEPFSIGDISFENGGNMPPHKSHQDGTGADLDHPIAIDWHTYEGSGVVNSSFDVNKSSELAKLFIAAGIQKIGFQHPDVLTRVNQWAEENSFTGRVRDWSGHKSHFHINL